MAAHYTISARMFSFTHSGDFSRWIIAGIFFFSTWFVFKAAGEAPAAEKIQAFTLSDYLQKVLEQNERIQIQILEVEIRRHQLRREYGIYEPEFVGGVERIDRDRPNTVEQERSLRSGGVFLEENTIYNAGLEALAPTGARLRIGTALRDLSNNLPRTRGTNTLQGGREYEMTAGFSLVQPLLKNAGWTTTRTGIRLAALASEIAFQDYRRQLMQTIARAEAAYWELYLAQEQYRISLESVSVAETILKENRTRLEVGKGSDLDVFEADARLALRNSVRSEAQQRLYEASNRALALYAQKVGEEGILMKAVDEPKLHDAQLSKFQSRHKAYESNPDYLAQFIKIFQEQTRIRYARNQRLPQLDLVASLGVNGLGDHTNEAWDELTTRQFPYWTVGAEMRIPLGGGVRARHDLAVAVLSQKEAELALQEIEVGIANGLDTSIRKANSTREGVKNYESVIQFNQNLLDTQMARLDVGRTTTRLVLETAEDLFEAQIAALDNMVLHQRALLELELIEGSTLEKRNLELTRKDLEARTRDLVRRGKITDSAYEEFLKKIRSEYDRRRLENPKPLP